jgi:Zn-dependent M28 family amino/carboxypeptidase
MVVSEPAAARLAASVGAAAETVKPREQEGLTVEETDVELTVEYKLSEQPLPSPNVVAWFEGCDPKLKHEHIIIGAHLDHLGLRRGEVYPGADDNASGTTAILQIAQAIKMNPEKPRRSVLFMAFAAEELGLAGSRHYCEHPLKPLDNLICMLNLDMVGRNEENKKETAEENEDTMHLVGSKKTAIGLHETMLEANRYVNFKLEFDQEKAVFHRSDHLSFHRKGIPVAFIFCGFTPRYHRPTDSLEGIQYSKITAAARWGYLALMLAADHGHYQRQTEEEGDGQKAAASPS